MSARILFCFTGAASTKRAWVGVKSEVRESIDEPMYTYPSEALARRSERRTVTIDRQQLFNK